MNRFTDTSGFQEERSKLTDKVPQAQPIPSTRGSDRLDPKSFQGGRAQNPGNTGNTP